MDTVSGGNLHNLLTVVAQLSLQYDSRMPDTDPTSADAEWKKIQQNTFTRWCNEHLKCVNQYIYNLETDLCDGLKLIALLQVLSHKKLPRHTKKPVFKPQKIENVSIALKFIEDENIRLVNIGKRVHYLRLYSQKSISSLSWLELIDGTGNDRMFRSYTAYGPVGGSERS